MAVLAKTQTVDRVTYTGLDDLDGMVLVIEKDSTQLVTHQVLAAALAPRSWQEVTADIDANNTLV